MNRTILYTIMLLTCCCILCTTLVSWKSSSIPPETNLVAIQSSVEKGFALLQTSGAIMIAKSKCASCHHSTMTAMVAGVMAKKGLAALDTTAVMRQMAMVGTLDFIGNPNLNNQFVSAKFLAPYVLLGLNAQNYPGDFSTDIALDYVISQALPNGSFRSEFARVPFECGDVHLTALSIRAIDVYASPAKKTRAKQLVQQTRIWLEQQHPTQQQEIAFQLMGMHWCGSNQGLKAAVAEKLLAMQNKDGGWSQLPTMASDAYATGQALYALSLSGTADAANASYQNGIAYLLRTQDKEGAWTMVTRSNPIQPFVNTQFPPYDDNQFISAAASNWAVLALASSLPDKK